MLTPAKVSLESVRLGVHEFPYVEDVQSSPGPEGYSPITAVRYCPVPLIATEDHGAVDDRPGGITQEVA